MVVLFLSHQADVAVLTMRDPNDFFDDEHDS